jgi:hypothetical protein
MATPDADEASAVDSDRTGRESTATVELSQEIVERAEERLAYTVYDDVDEYVAVVLRETLARVEAESDDEPVDVDEAEVRDRLESLGYLDS